MSEFPTRCALCGALTPAPGTEAETQSKTEFHCQDKEIPGRAWGDVFWGLSLIFRRRSLLTWAMAPVGVNLLLILLFFAFFWNWFYQYVHHFLSSVVQSLGWLNFLGFVLGAFSTVAITLLALLLFLPLLSLVAIPFLDPLAARTEALLHRRAEAAPFHLGVILSEVLWMSFFKLIVLLPALLFLFIPLVGPLLLSCVLAALLSLDFLDVIWMRKGYRFEEKMAFIKRQKRDWFLFFLPLTLMIWVPVLQIVIFPAATVGAVRFFLRAQKNAVPEASQ